MLTFYVGLTALIIAHLLISVIPLIVYAIAIAAARCWELIVLGALLYWWLS